MLMNRRTFVRGLVGVITATLLNGCDYDSWNNPDDWTRICSDEYCSGAKTKNERDSIELLSNALLDYITEWDIRFNNNPNVEKGFNTLTILWHEGESFDYFQWKGNAGIYVEPSIIEVAKKGIYLGDTAFFHELTHCALYWTCGDSGKEHTGVWTPEHEDLIKDLKYKYKHL
jgi:hypothetical protein